MSSTSAPLTPAGSPSPFASLPQSKTAEGYYVLGQPDAPVAIEFFSDFL
jgi:hypothetical protein